MSVFYLLTEISWGEHWDSPSCTTVVETLYYQCLSVMLSVIMIIILQLFRNLHVAYTDMFSNPFYTPGTKIKSK